MPANHLSESPLFERGISIEDDDNLEVDYRHQQASNHQRHYSSSRDSLLDLEGGGVVLRDAMGLDRNANQIDRDDSPLFDHGSSGIRIQIHPDEIYVHTTSECCRNGCNNGKKSGCKHCRLFPKERRKTALGFVLLVWGFVCNSFSIFLTHQKIPDRKYHPPLPDLALDNITKRRWLNDLSDIIVIFCTLTTAILIISHKHRWIISRRVFLMLSLLYMMRSVTMYVTVLPLANNHVYCSPKLNSTSFGETMWAATVEVIKLIAAGGLGFMGKKTLCGDYIFSGHTIIFMMTYLLIREYTPKELVSLHWAMWATAWTGIVGLLISHGHYTIDVIIGYYATTRLFWIYHALANKAENKRRCHSNHLSEVWWFPIFQYFEGNVSGKLPYEYSMPRLSKKSRIGSYAYKTLHMVS